MSLLEVESVEPKKLGALFGPVGYLVGIIGDVILEFLKEEELYDLWLDFYNRTFMIWHDCKEPTPKVNQDEV